MSQEMVVVESHTPAPLSAHEIKAQVQLIQSVMREVMQDGQHYGTIPGTDKPTLLKAGAEKLAMTFRLAPSFLVTKTELGTGHREYEVICTLKHINSDMVIGQGVGCCSTMESKYRWRNAKRQCPSCEQGTISKSNYAKGDKEWWYCKECKAKFDRHDPVIVNQGTGRTENPDIADVFNTVLKMAKKRAQVDATLTATAASDIFTQDLEETIDEPGDTGSQQSPGPQKAPAPAKPESGQKAGDNGDSLITESQRKRLFALCKEHKLNHADLKAFLSVEMHVESSSDIKKSQYDQLCQWIEDGDIQEWCLTQAERQAIKEEGQHASA